MSQTRNLTSRGFTPGPVALIPEDEKALKRITPNVTKLDRWDIMSWYLRIAQTNIGNMTPGDLLILKEEVEALERTLFVPPRASQSTSQQKPTYTSSQIEEFQKQVLSSAENLIEQGEVNFGPFELEIYLRFPILRTQKQFSRIAITTGKVKGVRFTKKKIDPNQRNDSYEEFYSSHTVRGGNPLIYYLAFLLEEFGKKIKRCPKCGKLFLQLRTKARFCSRRCQSIAFMNKARAKEKEDKHGKKRKSRPGGN